MRTIFAIIAGVFIVFATAAGFEGVSSALYPVSGDIAAADRVTLAALVASIPMQAKMIIVTGWLVAPFAGSWACLRIGDRASGGWIVTALFLLAALYNQITLPYPPWMQACSVAMPLLGGWLAQRIHRKPYPGEPLLG